MSNDLRNACREGDVSEVRSRLDDFGESIYSVTPFARATPMMLVMRHGRLTVFQMLADGGADLPFDNNQ
jgi:hypothetical protein